MATIKIELSDEMVSRLDNLKASLGASSTSEAVRRALMSDILLREALSEAKDVTIKGNNPAGESIKAIIA